MLLLMYANGQVIYLRLFYRKVMKRKLLINKSQESKFAFLMEVRLGNL